MSWVLLDPDFPNHPAIAQAGGDAMLLFVFGLCYCQREKTDGVIPAEDLASFGIPRAAALAQRLVDVGLWEAVPGGFGPVRSQYFKLPRKRASLTHLKAALVKFWGAACAYCGSATALHIEHIQPVSRGGSDLPKNLTLACPSCNYAKGTQTAEEFGHPHVREIAKGFL